jgi:hypothetical protein
MEEEIREEGEHDMWVPLSVRVRCNPGRDCCFPGVPNSSKICFRRDSQVQGINDRDLKFKVHSAEALRV